MKNSVVFLTLVLEMAFIIYCIHMTYLLDVHDPTPKEWLFSNFLIGAAILGFGYLVVTLLNTWLNTWLNRDFQAQDRRN